MTRKFLLLLSDTHIGSNVALWPEHFKSQTGHELPQSVFQKWLYECWGDMQEWAKTTISDICDTDEPELFTVFNGDVIEGIHHKTIEIMSPNKDDQYTAAVQLLEPIRELSDKMFMVKGTECHTQNAESTIGDILKCEVNPDTGHAAFDHLKLDVNGCIMDFAHHTSATTRPYLEASIHGIQMGVAVMEAHRNGQAVPHVVCRAHRHRHGIFKDGNSISAITGPWQGLTRHGRKVVPAAVCNPSVVLFEFKEGQLLPETHEMVYVPKETPVHLL